MKNNRIFKKIAESKNEYVNILKNDPSKIEGFKKYIEESLSKWIDIYEDKWQFEVDNYEGVIQIVSKPRAEDEAERFFEYFTEDTKIPEWFDVEMEDKDMYEVAEFVKGYVFADIVDTIEEKIEEVSEEVIYNYKYN